MTKEISIIKGSPMLLLAIPISLISFFLVFVIRPFIHVRIGFLRSDRIGHFAANTELYLCEKDESINRSRVLDLFYFPRNPCNQQLAQMWKRELNILPWFFMRPMDLIIRRFDFLSSFKVDEARGHDRDIDDLYDKYPTHLHFTDEEEIYGESKLRDMGIPEGSQFVCLTVRDSAYLNEIYSGSSNAAYDDFRNCDIKNYILAIEELTERGYFVIRMGAKVNFPLNSSNPKVIDYASNGMRSEFMDIYLGSKCVFCITNGTGFDAIPNVYRRPIALVDAVPFGINHQSWGNSPIVLSKHHIDISKNRELTMSEIFEQGAAYFKYSSDYESSGISLIGNSPEEIRDAILELTDRIEGVWKEMPEDKNLQQKFWDIFDTDKLNWKGNPWHGKVIKSRYSAKFLRSNKEWLNS